MSLMIFRFLTILVLSVFLTSCTPGKDTTRTETKVNSENVTISKKVLAIIYNPIIESRNSNKLTEVLKWNNPDSLIQEYIRDVKEASWNIVEYSVVERKEFDEFPQHLDGFRYNDSTFMQAWNTRTFRDPGGDYKKIVSDFNIVGKVESHAIDEVWLFGAPGFGWWESTMAGNGAYYCNSDPLEGITCSRLFIIMGFNYERGVDCMLEDLGHRTESIMWHVYGSWEPNENNPWNKFTLYDKVANGRAQCGNIHFAPNSDADYDWGNKMYVDSYCDDWYSYPVLPGHKKSVNCQEWGGGDMRLHHIWWLKHLPRAAGTIDGKLNNWWKYIMNYDEYK